MKEQSFIGREQGEPLIARDGALIFELFRGSGLGIRNLSVATGLLRPRQKALPHFHAMSEEIYFILQGGGRVRVGDSFEDIREGEAVFVPKGVVHALENLSVNKPMKILAIMSLPYADDDTIFIGEAV